MSLLARTQREFLAALPAIHRRNIASNLGGALAAAYPAVRRLVGEAFFDEAAVRFAQAHPPRAGDLNLFGAAFGDFLGGYSHAAGLAYLPDVARLEWACHEAERAADAPAMDFGALARVAEADRARIVFTLQPAARLLDSRYRACAIRRANLDGDGFLEAIEGPEAALVSRAGNEVRAEALPRPEWEFLQALARGATLEQASAALAEADATRVLGRSLSDFVARGIVCGFRLAA